MTFYCSSLNILFSFFIAYSILFITYRTTRVLVILLSILRQTTVLGDVWRSGSVMPWSRSTKSTYASRRLVLGWVTVFGFNSKCGTFISVCNKPPRPTQPGHSFVGRCNEYQLKGGDALRLGSKGRYGLSVVGRENCVIPLLHTGHTWALSRCSLLYTWQSRIQIHVTLLL